MPHFKIQFDDGNKSLLKALEKRTALLEKMLKKNRKSDDLKPILTAINKMQAPKINIVQKDDSNMVRAMNKRINLLEDMLKQGPFTRGFTRGISVIPSPS